MGVARSTYAWKPRLERYGLDPRLLSRPPRHGPRRIAAELARPKWGGIRISEHRVWRVLKRFNLNTRSKRLALIARHADPYERKPQISPSVLRHECSRCQRRVPRESSDRSRDVGSPLRERDMRYRGDRI